MKRFPLLVLAALGLSLAACGGGGGGGDEDAFCDALDALSEQVADGDLADDDGLDDVTDTINDLIEAASEGEQLDAVNAVGQEIADASAGDADDSAETIQDELEDFADDCELDDFAIPPETTTTTTSATTATTAPTTGTTQGGGGGDGGALDEILVQAREAVPGGIAAEFAGLAQACFDGDMAACDELFGTTPVGSVDEAYGDTCGGRIDDGQGFELECAELITGPVPVPGDIAPEFAGLAQGCFGGDMVACDDLFRQTPSDTVDEAYGALCGGRVRNTDAFCVDIFGDVAFQ
jgi:hypothetical protein